MAEKVLTKNKAWVPFWGDKMNFVKGLDPLGLQNASEKAYSHLLPGLNNVTGLVRAYSFYCWLLREYARQIDSTDPAEQKRFIRKAEYILALMAHQQGIPGVSGVNYASVQFAKGETIFDLLAGIYKPDGSTENTYWAYHFGVFGAYYLGSMRQIGIIEEPMDPSGKPLGIYRITDERNANLKVTGKALAEAFESRVQTDNKAIFLLCLRENKVDHAQLTALAADFNLKDIHLEETEWKLLLEMLLDVDEPGIAKEHPLSMRKATLLHVLRLANRSTEGIYPRELAYYAYDAKGQEAGEVDDCLIGWYYYQLNEYYQYACTALLNAVLRIVEDEVGTGWMSVSDLVVETATRVADIIQRETKNQDPDTTLGDITAAITESEEDLFEEIEASITEIRMKNAFKLLWKLYQSNAPHINRLKAFIGERRLELEHEVLAFLGHVAKSHEQPLVHYIESFLLHHILYRHRYVAFNKIGNGSKSTEKFVIEDDYIRVIDHFDPALTGPRLVNLVSFLQDLQLLSPDREITGKGIEVLNQNIL
jgi:hypothetical protein